MLRTITAVLLRSAQFLNTRRYTIAPSGRYWKRFNVKNVSKVLLFASVPALVMAKEVNVDEVIKKADDLYSKDDLKNAYQYLREYKDVENVDLQWRIARLCYHVSKYYTDNKTTAKEIAEEGLAAAEQAIKIDPKSAFGYKWTGILINWQSEFEGYKKKIERSFDIKDNFMKSIELNPEDAVAKYLMGQWCFNVAAVPWYMRKAASLVFATPPTSSYEEALKYFDEAEKASPGFYCSNWLFLGKCYYQLSKKEDARKWLQKAADHKGTKADDVEAQKEARQLLAKL